MPEETTEQKLKLFTFEATFIGHVAAKTKEEAEAWIRDHDSYTDDGPNEVMSIPSTQLVSEEWTDAAPWGSYVGEPTCSELLNNETVLQS